MLKELSAKMALVVHLLVVFLMCFAASARAFRIYATCDNQMSLYVDGVLRVPNNNWKQQSAVYLRNRPQVVAIKCIDLHVVAGIYASMSDNVITDKSWKCKNFPSAPPRDWNTASFDDSRWSSAREITYTTPWAGTRFPNIDGNGAKWIWTPDLGANNVYCRRSLSLFSIFATCDNEMALYVDGLLKISNNNWKEQSALYLKNKPQVVAIKCIDKGVVAGIYASMSNGTVTDRSWKCQNFPSGPPSRWNTASFDDSRWSSAREITYTRPWAGTKFPNIDGTGAKWIWTPSLSANHVYCRKTFGAASGCGRCGTSPRDVEPACTRTEAYYVRQYNPRKCSGWWFGKRCTSASYTQKRLTRTVALPCCQGKMRNNFCYKTLAPTCGVSKYANAGERLTFIVGGTETMKHEFPWQAVVRQGGRLCGGTIIGRSHILTAAHCVDKRESVSVYVGRHVWSRYDSSQQFRTVPQSNIKMHESFDLSKIIHDIAVLELTTPLTFNENVTAACLPPSNANYVGKNVIISGWGRMGDDSLASGLRYTTVTVVSKGVCDRAFGTRPNVICASDGEGDRERSSCKGDSGGPMVIKQGGKFVVIGAASFVSGRGCAAGKPFAYADVSKYVTWVRSKM